MLNSVHTDEVTASRIDPEEDKSVTRFKKILLVRVLGSFLLIFIIIIQRVFSSYTRNFENALTDNFQELLGIKSYDDIPAIFYYFHQFRYIEILLAHLYFTLFFLTNALVTFKCLIVHFNTLVIVANIEILLAEPRPFWDFNGIVGAVCDPSFAFPSYPVFTIAFFFWYSSHCWDTDDEDGTTPFVRKLKVCSFVVILLFYGVSCLAMGLNYPSQIVLALLYSLMCFYIINFFDKMINNLIMRSSIQVDSAKRYTIYWLVYLLLLAVLSLIVYSSSDPYVNIVWLKNFVKSRNLMPNLTMILFLLVRMPGQPDRQRIRSERVLSSSRYNNYQSAQSLTYSTGAWSSFLRTAIIFAMAGNYSGLKPN